MDSPFPFGLPGPTAFYLTAYVVTLAVHVVFMNYVLAGTGYLAVAFLRPTGRADAASVAVVKDWMPLMLSGAITAGIAPLLFVQLVYKREFYTANLLLFNRWMAILPVLVVGFYALYLLKSAWLYRRPRWAAAAVAVVPLACVAFSDTAETCPHCGERQPKLDEKECGHRGGSCARCGVFNIGSARYGDFRDRHVCRGCGCPLTDALPYLHTETEAERVYENAMETGRPSGGSRPWWGSSSTGSTVANSSPGSSSRA